MARLWRDGMGVRREDRGPQAADLGRPAILPGGEVGRRRAWWQADEGSVWRRQVAFYNHR